MRHVKKAILAALLVAACASHPPNTPLRVLTYNIHAGKDAAGVDNLERVAALMKSTNADVVLLQEVDRNTVRSGHVDQLAELMRLTGFDGVLGKSLDYQGGDYGIAILSRWPITAHETIPLPIEPPQMRAGGSYEPRVAMRIETASPRGKLVVFNTHLDASRDDHYRLQEVRDLLGILAREHGRPFLAGGDFNSTPDSAVHEQMIATGFHDAWPDCGSGQPLTYPADVPAKRIDYVYINGYARCTSATVPDTQASDHRPVLVIVP